MEKIFFARGKGRVKKMLTVHSDGHIYKMNFLILDRTNPTRSERQSGAREMRFELLNNTVEIQVGNVINPADFPMPELVKKFINFLGKDQNE